MTVHRGKTHNYLGMPLDYTEDGTVNVRMIYYIDEIISECNKEEPIGSGINTSDAPEDL